MTKRYWAGVMLFSSLITGAAAWYMFTALQEKRTLTVPLQEVQKPMSAPTPAQMDSSANEQPLAGSTTPVTSTAAASADKPAASSDKPAGTRRVLFKIRSGAKEVYVIGDFNKWFRQPMKNNKGVWSIAVDLAPGTYEYKFVIDDKRVKDPNSKLVSKEGNSIIKVKAPRAQ